MTALTRLARLRLRVSQARAAAAQAATTGARERIVQSDALVAALGAETGVQTCATLAARAGFCARLGQGRAGLVMQAERSSAQADALTIVVRRAERALDTVTMRERTAAALRARRRVVPKIVR